MTFDLRIYIVVGIFIIVCISLMIFNFVIMYYGRKNVTLASKTRKWRETLYRQAMIVPKNKSNVSKHQKYLLKNLSDADNLVAYSRALQYIKSEFSEAYNHYMRDSDGTFSKLAGAYSTKPTIERTCFANFICNFPEAAGSTYDKLVDALISFIYNSDIYCRTNVVRAFCHIGTVEGVANALQVMSDRNLFIHNQLLTDILSEFAGDKEDLGEYLCMESERLNDNIMASIIQFITRFSDNYNEEFLLVLQNPSSGTKMRAAIIRYFEKNIYEPVRPVLVKFITHPTDINLTIEAITALALYPSPDTTATLINALFNPRWQIRYNASYALVRLLRKADLLKLLEGESEHVREIIDYMLELEARLQNTDQAQALHEAMASGGMIA